MKKIIKSSILFFSFFAFANQIKAQLASDKPVAKVAVDTSKSAAAKVTTVVTASSAPIDKTAAAAKVVPVIPALPSQVEKTTAPVKKSATIQVTDPAAGQGKAIAAPAAVTPLQLPTVSSQGTPPAKS
ncbi:hypothetical protein [Ferruginibacter profundus]